MLLYIRGGLRSDLHMAFHLILIIAVGGGLVKLRVHLSGCAFTTKNLWRSKLPKVG